MCAACTLTAVGEAGRIQLVFIQETYEEDSMKNKLRVFKEMRSYLLLWFTQMISGLGSTMTAYALAIWSYTQEGSALQTALLMVCPSLDER